MVEAGNHAFAQTEVSDFTVGDKTYKYYSLPALSDERYAKLPFSIRVLLESAVRNCDNFNVKRKSFSLDFILIGRIILVHKIFISMDFLCSR